MFVGVPEPLVDLYEGLHLGSFFGWAADLETLEPADSILVFVIPAAVEGRISTRDVEYVAVAVNGTVRAVAFTFDGPRGGRRFQAIVPESSLLEGKNRIQVFAVGQTNGDVILFSRISSCQESAR